MISIEQKPKSNIKSHQSKTINIQMDLFEPCSESDVLYKEITDLRNGLNKVRRRIFRDLDEMQSEIKLLKDENLKLKFSLMHENVDDFFVKEQ